MVATISRILKWAIENGMKMWTGFVWLRIGTMAGTCEHGNEPMGSIKDGEFIDYQLPTIGSLLCLILTVQSWNISADLKSASGVQPARHWLVRYLTRVGLIALLSFQFILQIESSNVSSNKNLNYKYKENFLTLGYFNSFCGSAYTSGFELESGGTETTVIIQRSFVYSITPKRLPRRQFVFRFSSEIFSLLY
jgi:hypothetical protein